MRNFILLAGLCFVVGCGPGGNTVTGKVTLSDGGAAPRGTVILMSEAGTFQGAIGADGTYTIEAVAAGDFQVAVTGVTEKPSDDADAGMEFNEETGEYTGEEAEPPKSLIKDIYFNPQTSGLTMTVPGGSYDLTLDSVGWAAAPAGGGEAEEAEAE
jgi:hypothetical protein